MVFTRLWRAILQGTFPVEFAKPWAGSGVERQTLITIGAEIEAVMVERGDNQDKGERLGRLAVRVTRLLGTQAYEEESPQRELAAALFRWADARRVRFTWDAENDHLPVLGYIVGAAQLAVATSMA